MAAGAVIGTLAGLAARAVLGGLVSQGPVMIAADWLAAKLAGEASAPG